MPKLTKRETDIIKLAEKEGNDADLMLLDRINEIIDIAEQKINEARQEVNQVVSEIKQAVDNIEPPKGDTGDKGDKGDRGEKGERGKYGKTGKSGKNGKDGKNGRDGIDGKDGMDGADGSPDTPQMIRDKLEFLTGGDRLDAKSIKGLEDFVKGLKLGGVVGGGFNYASVDNHWVDDETPGGTINGANKAFTLNFPPSPATSLHVFVNGSRMRITEDYTLSGQTITFVTAPPKTSIILVDYRI